MMPANNRSITTTGPTNRMVARSMAIRSKASSELMTLLKMPKEILFKIIKCIGVKKISKNLKAVTRFAMTSKQSLIIAEAAVGSLKELRSLEKRFGKPYFEVSSVKWALSEREDFMEMFPDISPESLGPDLGYLNLNGSLTWLPPLDCDSDSGRGTRDIIETCFRKPRVKARELKELIAQAKRLHLKLPPSFLTMVRSEDLQRCIPSFDDKYFFVGSLRKCTRIFDRNAGGYILRFLLNGEDWAWNLYLDTMGQHCVFFTTEDIEDFAQEVEERDEDEDEDEDLPEKWAGGAVLQALDFEEFMYHTWINQTLWETLPTGKEISEAQRTYLEHMRRP